jgi:hypothetical protein
MRMLSDEILASTKGQHMTRHFLIGHCDNG